jgi:hypothetical protein
LVCEGQGERREVESKVCKGMKWNGKLRPRERRDGRRQRDSRGEVKEKAKGLIGGEE